MPAIKIQLKPIRLSDACLAEARKYIGYHVRVAGTRQKFRHLIDVRPCTIDLGCGNECVVETAGIEWLFGTGRSMKTVFDEAMEIQ